MLPNAYGIQSKTSYEPTVTTVDQDTKQSTKSQILQIYKFS